MAWVPPHLHGAGMPSAPSVQQDSGMGPGPKGGGGQSNGRNNSNRNRNNIGWAYSNWGGPPNYPLSRKQMAHIGQDFMQLQSLASAMGWRDNLGGYGKGGFLASKGKGNGKGKDGGNPAWLQDQAGPVRMQSKAKAKAQPTTTNIK